MSEATKIRERKASVKVVLWTSKTLADGTHPFVVRINKDGTRKHIMTGFSLHPKYWNAKKHEIRQNYPSDKRKVLEKALENWQQRFADAAEGLATSDARHNAEDIVHKVADERNDQRRFQLLEYFDELITQYERLGQVGNRKVYREVRNNLARFIGEDKDVAFDQVTVKFCNEWELKMKAEVSKETTLSIKFRTLRAVLNKAIANGYAKAEGYPFARNTAEKHKFQISKFDTKTIKRAISRADVRKIAEYQPAGRYTADDFKGIRNPNAAAKNKNVAEVQRQTLAKNLFMFSYYCGGINFVDIAALRWKNINTGLDGKQRLNYIREKSGGSFSIPLLPQALSILERYRTEQINPNAYIFPVLNAALHKTPTQIQNRGNKVLGHVNNGLKAIAAQVGITANLTSYVARHTFATTLKRLGVSTTVISEAMGHGDERTTRIYLSEFDNDLVDAAFENL